MKLCGATWWHDGGVNVGVARTSVCIRPTDHSDDSLPDKGLGSRHKSKEGDLWGFDERKGESRYGDLRR